MANSSSYDEACWWVAKGGTADERGRHVLLTWAAITAAVGPQTVACLGSAAVLHQLDRLGQSPQRVRLYRGKGRPWRDEQVAVLTCGLPAHHVTSINGVPCTTAPRTVVDLCRWVGFRSGVVVADSALRQGVTSAEVAGVVADCARWPGIRKARRVMQFADGRAATPLESISRVAFHELGLPAPALQVALDWDADGKPTVIVDFLWDQARVVGEADGMLKYTDPPALCAEKLRQEYLESLGYVVIRWTWVDIWRRPDWVAWRIRRALESRTSAVSHVATSNGLRPKNRTIPA